MLSDIVIPGVHVNGRVLRSGVPEVWAVFVDAKEASSDRLASEVKVRGFGSPSPEARSNTYRQQQ